MNEAVREALAEDADDLAAFEDREKEPELMFEDEHLVVYVVKIADRKSVYRALYPAGVQQEQTRLTPPIPAM